MRVVIQRVSKASVVVNGKVISKINKGLLIYLGIHKTDSVKDVIAVAKKVSNLRIFNDNNDKMNLNIKAVKGEFLIVSQFTLYGDTKKGNRPSFTDAAKPKLANLLYEDFIKELKKEHIVKSGIFGANMQITSINDGPVTIII